MKSIVSLLLLLAVIIAGLLFATQSSEPPVPPLPGGGEPKECAGNNILDAFTEVFQLEYASVRTAEFDETKWADLLLMARSEVRIQQNEKCKTRMESFVERIQVEQVDKREEYKRVMIEQGLEVHNRIKEKGDFKLVDECLSNLKSLLLEVKDKGLVNRIKGAIRELELIHWVVSDDNDSGEGELNALISRKYNSQERVKWWLNYLDKSRQVEELVAIENSEVMSRRGELQAKQLAFASFAEQWKRLYPLYASHNGRTFDMKYNGAETLSAEEISKYGWYKSTWISELGHQCPDSDIQICFR